MDLTRSVRAATVALVAAALAAPALGQTLEQRLERIAAELETQREQFHIPGMSIAIVKDGQVVMSRGFGLADVERGVKATDETMFAAGSTTKAFTATLIGMQVDAGEMSWDDPVRKHLPDYRLSDSEANEKVVIRDLLCHRTGLASMTLLWYGTDIRSDEVLATSYQAEMLHGFRDKWNYSNVSFLAAGTASGLAAGVPWTRLATDRLLHPLGMTTSTLTYDAAQADPRMATGYLWDKEDETLTLHAMRPVDAVAPAGSLNTNAREFAQWVRFQLARGEIDGRRLISEAQHEQTWTKHSEIGGGVDYGLGWMIRDWNGHRVIEHAGGIDGFTAEVALLPDDGIGFALLMNLFGAPLQETSRQIVFDGLLGEWSDADGADAVAAESFDRYVGTYLSSIPQFDKLEVLVQNGRLAVDVPGQMVFELDPPDDEGKRQFTITDQVEVRFTEQDDRVVSMTMYQAGMEFEMPREGVEVASDSTLDADSVRPYLGKYHFEQLNADVEVLVQNDRLAVDVPGQMVFEMHEPDDEGRWIFRARDTIWVTFDDGDDGDDGAVASLTMTQDGRAFTLPRTSGPANLLPTVGEVMTLMGLAPDVEHLGRFANMKMRGRVRFAHMGVEGTVELMTGTGGRMHETIDLGRFGTIRQIVDGDRGRLEARFMPDPELNAEMLEQLSYEHPNVWLVDWRKTFDTVAVKGRDEIDGRPVYRLTAKTAGGSTYEIAIDAENGRMLSRESVQANPMGMKVKVTTRMSDYREVGGRWLPFHTEVENAMSGRFEVDITSLEPVASWPAEVFAVEPGA